ncbi:hypothetical protein ACIO3O_15970 [Streptomyces sp. NPDC087440]|uniref:hypothetical protein n=1 Tax=Streptomyces sp. NPDC087440 TaxID=3365790 RepID=UPI003803F174
MGLTYSYEIHLPPKNVATLLAHMAALAPPERHKPPLDLTLPDGQRITLPFTSHFEGGTADWSRSDESWFELDTSLLFDAYDGEEADDDLRAYAEEHVHEPRADGRFQVGYIYASIGFGSPPSGYAVVACWAATSRMSRLFERSAGVRTTFTDLTAAAGGVCCLFDFGDGSPEEVLWLNGESMRERIPGTRFPDEQSLVATWPDLPA